MTTFDPLTDYDIFDRVYVLDPFPVLGEIRESECPIAHTERWGGSWLPTRYEDVVAMAQEKPQRHKAHRPINGQAEDRDNIQSNERVSHLLQPGGCADDRFELLIELAPRQENAPPAAPAHQPNIRAHANNRPFIAAARMLLP